MNCPPPPYAGSSLAIMPRMIYPHFREFHCLAQFYWRDDDFPEMVDKFFLDFFENNNPYELTAGEQDYLRKNAVKMAEFIGSYREIVDSMLNWLNIYDNPPLPEK